MPAWWGILRGGKQFISESISSTTNVAKVNRNSFRSQTGNIHQMANTVEGRENWDNMSTNIGRPKQIQNSFFDEKSNSFSTIADDLSNKISRASSNKR